MENDFLKCVGTLGITGPMNRNMPAVTITKT